jgi:tetraacyldisaccharide 4'-kinase
LILSAASSIYGAAAAWRRRWYAGDPARRRRLAQPVVSIGNLTTGGSGKSPVTGELARLLAAQGERPAILSRGYARRVRTDGVTVVSDGRQVLAGLDRAGDEPLMLAEALPGVAVLVSEDRHLAGALGEARLGVTVHLLDDGFQHLTLWRDVDLLLVDETIEDERVLPAGRLRERLEAARSADALLVTGASASAAARLTTVLSVDTAFAVRRAIGQPVWLHDNHPVSLPPGAPVAAMAGIARPDRFFGDVRAAGFSLVHTVRFRDHHPFSEVDVQRVLEAARAAGAAAVFTTDKDAVRLDRRVRRDPPIARVPLVVAIEPPAFAGWLIDRVRAARAGPARTETSRREPDGA